MSGQEKRSLRNKRRCVCRNTEASFLFFAEPELQTQKRVGKMGHENMGQAMGTEIETMSHSRNSERIQSAVKLSLQVKGNKD